MNYGLTIENQNTINDKAKEKKDGCYSFRGVAYRVRNGKVTHLACNGEIVQPFGAFNVVVGTYKDLYNALKVLKTI